MKPARRLVRQTALCIELLMAASGWAGIATGCKRDMPLQIGAQAPEFSALDLNDKTVKLSDFKGKVVVLRFWSSGCLGCVAEMPLLDELSKRYTGKGLVVLAVNVADPKEKVERAVRDLNISYPVLLDPVRIAAVKYRVSAVPTTFFLDRNGVARKMVVGALKEAETEETVSVLL